MFFPWVFQEMVGMVQVGAGYNVVLFVLLLYPVFDRQCAQGGMLCTTRDVSL